MVICKSCGFEVDEVAKFCKNCKSEVIVEEENDHVNGTKFCTNCGFKMEKWNFSGIYY